jgi:hypothetical protein
MFYHAFAGVPEWAPPHEDHILYSEGILKSVQYAKKQIKYTAVAADGVEYLRLSFRPGRVTVRNEISVSGTDSRYIHTKNPWQGDYAITIKHSKPCVF